MIYISLTLRKKVVSNLNTYSFDRLFSQITKNDQMMVPLIPSNMAVENKHNPPANKEWNNSVYSYNKNNLRPLPVKDLLAKKLIKSYFFLNKDKAIARSRRMRSLIRKSTTKKLFVSSPEIKQTNDKVTITIYSFDRERQFLFRKLYFNMTKWEKLKIQKKGVKTSIKSRPFNQYNIWHTNKQLDTNHRVLEYKDEFKSANTVKLNYKTNPVKFINHVIKRSATGYVPKKIIYKYKPWFKGTVRFKTFKRLLKIRYKMFIKDRKKIISKKIPYFGLKHYNQMDFIYDKFSNNQKYIKAKKMLIYSYITYLLSLIDIKVLSFEDTTITNKKKLKKLNEEDYEILEEITNKNPLSKKNKNILVKKKVPFYVRRFQQYNIPDKLDKSMFLHFYSNKGHYSILLKNFSFSNFIMFLLSYLSKILAKSNSRFKLKDDFSSFSKKYFLNVFYKPLFYVADERKLKRNLKAFNKDIITINGFIKLIVNHFKFGKFLSGLKILISRIYNKKAELNIVNLKSPQLNTDIFTEAVALKLKKRLSLLKVMSSSFQLIKLPYKFESANKQFSVNNLEILNTSKTLKLDNFNSNLGLEKEELNYTDSMQTILKTLFSRSLTNQPKTVTGTLTNGNNDQSLNKITSILNTIKYKWVTGVRLEVAGRLTRRYTASRSVFKFKYKGSLKNTDYSRKLDFMNNSMPNVILRNLTKSNSQHTFLKSKKRIGAFGLKTWMSSY